MKTDITSGEESAYLSWVQWSKKGGIVDIFGICEHHC
jgi:hypothetical protein